MADSDPTALSRRLGLFPATNLVIANMIGAGIFTTSGLLLAELRNPILMIALWAGGGLLALCGALCYGALGAAMPRAGGEYVFLSRQFHPILGFLTGWVSFFVGFSAPLAATALGFSEYLTSALHGTLAWGDDMTVKRVLAVLVLVTLTLVHLRGLELGAKVQNVLTVGKVMLIATLIGVGFALGNGSFGHFAERVPVQRAGVAWKTIGLSLMWIMFAYSGWNAAVYVGSEVRNPRRNLPLSLLAGTGIVLVLYCALNVLFVYAVPPRELHGAIAVGGLAARWLFGPSAQTVISLLIAFALLSSISALIILGPRIYYAMAQDGYFFRSLAHVHPVFRAPSKAIVLQCLIAIAMAASGTFDQILTYMGFCLGIFPIVVVLGVFKLPRTDRSRLYQAAALLFAAVSIVILTLAYFERPAESSIAVVTVLAGVPLYALFAHARAAAAITRKEHAT